VSRAGRVLDRMESEGDGFHERVRAGFAALAAAAPDQWLVVDGDASAEVVAGRVAAAVATRLDRA